MNNDAQRAEQAVLSAICTVLVDMTAGQFIEFAKTPLGRSLLEYRLVDLFGGLDDASEAVVAEAVVAEVAPVDATAADPTPEPAKPAVSANKRGPGKAKAKAKTRAKTKTRAKKTKNKAKAAKAPRASGNPTPAASASVADNEEKILLALRASAQPMRNNDLQRAIGASKMQVYGALKRLTERGLVEPIGERQHRVYRAKPTN